MPTWLNKDKPTSNALFNISLGCYANASLVHKFGANYDIGITTVPETVWTGSGLYPWSAFSTAQTLYCISTDAGDTGDLKIQGLDANYDPQTETVVLNGLTAVTTTNAFIRVFRMSYMNTTANSGDVTARTVSGTGVVVGQIDADAGQTLMAIYTIPNGHTGYFTGGDLSVNANKDAQLQFFVREFGEPFQIGHTAETSGVYAREFSVPLIIPSKADLDVRITRVENNNTRVSANFDLILVKD